MREFDSTNNRSVLKKLARRQLAHETGRCDRCPVHGGENAVRQPRDDHRKNHRRSR